MKGLGPARTVATPKAAQPSRDKRAPCGAEGDAAARRRRVAHLHLNGRREGSGNANGALRRRLVEMKGLEPSTSRVR
jgi:hypothetical protein